MMKTWSLTPLAAAVDGQDQDGQIWSRSPLQLTITSSLVSRAIWRRVEAVGIGLDRRVGAAATGDVGRCGRAICDQSSWRSPHFSARTKRWTPPSTRLLDQLVAGRAATTPRSP